MTELTFDEKLAEATLAEKDHPICLNGKLRAEYETVTGRIAAHERERAIAEAKGDTRLSASRPAAVAADEKRAEELRREMAKYTEVFRLRALDKQGWNALWAKHPPRTGLDGKRDARDGVGINAETFYPELIRKSVISPVLDDARWAKLDAAMTDAQFDKIATACWLLNRAEEDIPLSPAA